MITKLIKDKKSLLLFLASVVIVVMASVLYFSRLDFNTALVNDEHQSFSVAINVMEGNGLVRTDFIQHEKNPASYRRGWPATYLLALWMRILGVSEVSARSLSALYGVLFIISLLYISYRLSNNYVHSVISSLLILGVFELTQHFRTVRMYSLEILLSIWLYYLLYRFLQGNNRFWKNREKNKKLSFWAECLDYDWIYFPAVVCLIYLCFVNFVNGVILLGGAALFIVMQGIFTKKKKFVFATVVGILCCAICFANIMIFYSSGKFLFAASVFRKFVYYAGFSIQPMYLKTILAYSGHYLLGIALVVIAIVTSILRKPTSSLVYIFCINIFTLFFYCFFSGGRYDFRARYILDLLPWAVMLYAYAYINFKELVPKIAYFILIPMLAGALIHYAHFVQLYAFSENSDNTDFLTAYGKVSEYYNLEEENIPIAESFLRVWYSNQVFNHPIYGEMTRKTAFEDLYNFVLECPQGIITVEEIKADKLNQDVDRIIYNWTDRISGRNVDNTGVNVSHYCFLSPDTFMNESSESGVHVSDDGLELILGEDAYSAFEEYDDIKVVFVRIRITTGEGEKERYFGLLMSDEYTDGKCLRYHISQEELINIPVEKIEDATMDNAVAVYYGTKLEEGVELK